MNQAVRAIVKTFGTVTDETGRFYRSRVTAVLDSDD